MVRYPPKSPARAGLRLALLAGALLPLPAAALAAGAGDGARAAAKPRVIELGRGQGSPRPSCPRSCEAIGRVTGYQVLAGGRRRLYRAPADGKIVAWSITLARPRLSQIRFFNDFYGSPPRARLAILRPGARNRFRLTGQSHSVDLTRYLGQRPVFALQQPLTVKRGYFIALTVPTWAPAFATGLSLDNAWRASRPRRRCRDVKRRDAQQQRKSLRAYGCVYATARLLYTATMVATPAAEKPSRRRAR